MWSEDLRQWHYLRQLKGNRVPTRWVLCDYIAAPEQQEQPGQPARLQLQYLGMYSCHLDSTGLDTDNSLWLVATDNCLLGLKTLLSQSGCTWVIGYRISALLEMIGWWAEADNGMVTARRPGSACVECEDESVASGHGQLSDHDSLSQEYCPCRQHLLESPYRQFVTTDPPFIVSCWWDGRSMTIMDTRNYWPESPHDMGLAQRRNMPHVPTARSGRSHWEGVIQARLEALRQQLGDTLVWWQTECNATWAATTPGLAWSCWRRHHIPDRGILVHGDRLALQLERLGLYGGDCRVAYQGKVVNERCSDLPPPHSDTLPVLTLPSVIASVDVRGLYPSIVADSLLPARLIAGRIGDHRIMDLEQTDQFAGVALVRVRTDRPIFPCRVTRDTHVPLLHPGVNPYKVAPHSDHLVLYPVGEFDTVLAGRELVQTLVTGAVTRVYYWTQYEVADVASSYMRALHEQRSRAEDEGEYFLARMCKLLANSLIGRWAAWSRRWEEVPGARWEHQWGTWPCVDVERGEVHLRRALAGVVQEQRPHGEAENSLPILAACVTAAGRCRMHLLRELIGQRNWYYQDTDGLLVDWYHWTDTLHQQLREGSRLGQPEVRHTDLAATILGKRCYWYAGQWTVAGAKQAEWDALQEEWVQEVIDGAATLIHRGAGMGVRTRTMKRAPRRTEVGARVKPDGWTEPWEVQPRER